MLAKQPSEIVVNHISRFNRRLIFRIIDKVTRKVVWLNNGVVKAGCNAFNAYAVGQIKVFCVANHAPTVNNVVVFQNLDDATQFSDICQVRMCRQQRKLCHTRPCDRNRDHRVKHNKIVNLICPTGVIQDVLTICDAIHQSAPS